MRKSVFPFACAVAFAIAACSGSGSGSNVPVGLTPFLPQAGPFGDSRGKIKHVVIIVQENRSFDNFFDCFPGTDCVKSAPGPGPQPGPTTPASPCPNPAATPTPGPTPTPIAITFGAKLPDSDIDHTYCSAFITAYDSGKLDGFYWEGSTQQGIPTKTYAYQVVAEKHIQPYWDMAAQYVLADRTFPTQASSSFTAHQDLIRGDTLINSTQAIVDNPGPNGDWGCPAKHDYTSLLLTSNKLNDLQYLAQQGPYPCFAYSTIRDLLDAKSVTWRYYTPIWPGNGGLGYANPQMDAAGVQWNAMGMDWQPIPAEHIASALDRPTVTLFSETDPAQWGPRNARGIADKAMRNPRSGPTALMTAASPAGMSTE